MRYRHSKLDRPSRRIPIALTSILALALIGGACGGTEESGSKDRPATDVNAKPEVNAANCPVKALDSATAPVEITVWHAYSALTQKALEKSVADYNASQTKVKVNVEAQGTYPELLKKYSERLGDPASLPDVIFAEDTNLRFMVDSGSVIPTGDCIAADPDSKTFYDDLIPAVAATYSIKGVVWPAAFGVSMPILYVNDVQLRQAGMDTSTPLATLADIRTAAEKLKAANISGLEAPTVMQLYGWYYETWINGAGQTVVNEANGHDGLATKSTMNNDAALKILQWMHDMAKDGLMKSYAYSSDINQYLAMGNKTSTILIDGSRAITSVVAITNNAGKDLGDVEGIEGVNPADLQGVKLRILPIPGLKKAGQASAAGSAAYLVKGDKPERVAAGWDFLQYFNSTPSQVDWTRMGSYLPVTNTVRNSPEIKDFFANDEAGKYLSVVMKQLEESNPEFPNPIIGPYDWFRTNVQSMMERVVQQGQDPKSNLDQFHTDFQKALDDYSKEVAG